MSGASIETTLKLWQASLRDIKERRAAITDKGYDAASNREVARRSRQSTPAPWHRRRSP
jgi:hypothetical protein